MLKTKVPTFTLYWEYMAGSIVVQAMLEEIGAEYQLRYVDMGAGEHHSKDFKLLNPAERVPALGSADGETIGETGAIITLLSEMYPDGQLSPAPGDKDRAAFLFWLNVMTTSGYMTAGRVGHPERYAQDENAIAQVAEQASADYDAFFDVIEAAIAGDPHFMERGLPFSLGHIHQMLTNPIYAGRIRHKTDVHPGQHPPIIDPQEWGALQQRLIQVASVKRSEQTGGARLSKNTKSKLIGKIFDETGDRLTPSHKKTSKGKRLRYYVSRRLTIGHRKHETGGWRLSAHDFEDRVGGLIATHLGAPSNLKAMLIDPSVEQLAFANNQIALMKSDLSSPLTLIDRIVIKPGEISIQLCSEKNAKVLHINKAQLIFESLAIRSKFQQRKRDIESKIILGGETNPRDEVLWANIAKGNRYFDMIRDGQTYTQIADAEGTSKDRVKKLADFAFLAPDIIRDVMHGTQPIGLTTEWLIRHSIPADWQEQRYLISTL